MKQLRVVMIVLLFATSLATSPQPSGAQIDDPDLAFLTAAYRDLLGRDPEPGGLAYWRGVLTEGVAASAVAEAIGDSVEQRRLVVTQAYQRVLKRDPDADGLDYWSEDIIDRSSETDLYSLFFGSQEYFNASNETNAGYVAALYRDILTRIPDEEGMAFWIDLINTGASRSSIASQFISSFEAILQPNLSITASLPASDSISNDLSR